MIHQGFFLIKSMVSEKIKQKAAKSLTDKGEKFSVNYKGQKLEFTIKKLVLETLIRISGERSRLVKYTKDTKSLEVIQSMGKNAPILARCVAIAIINSQPVPNPEKKRRFRWFRKEEIIDTKYLTEDQLTKIFRESLTSQELNTLNKLIVEQMDSDYFFAATISIGGIDLLRPMSEMVTDPHSQSGEE